MEPLPEDLKEFIAGAPVCRIATVGPRGEPSVTPVCPVFDGKSTVYIDVSSRGITASALGRNDRIAVLFDEYYDDWSKLKSVLLRCRAKPAQGAEKARAWGILRAKFPQYKDVGWEPRLTLALRIYDWRRWGGA